MAALSQAFRVTAATKGAQFLFRKKNSSSLVKHEDGFVCVGVPQAPLSLETCTLQMFPEWGRKSRGVNHWDRFMVFPCQMPRLKARTSAGPVLVYVPARCFQLHSQLGWILSLVSCKKGDFLLSQGPPELLCKAEGVLSLPAKIGRTP